MTPLLDALRSRAAGATMRCHVPGHAGKSVIAGWDEPFAIDLTELPGTGSLYGHPDAGPIRDAERLYAKLYEAGDCLFLTGGATQGILAMLAAFASPGDSVILDRNCHISVHNALALMDLHPLWLQAPLLEPFSVSAGVPPWAVRDALDAHRGAACVLVTSPTYYGLLSDLEAIAELCRDRATPLLVDAAHGAHLPFLRGFASPTALGATAAVLSAHKTLPALGQAAFLLTGADIADGARAGDGFSLLRGRTALFGSSSPSYVLMASLDAARDYMEAEGKEAIREVAEGAARLRNAFPNLLGHPRNPAPVAALDPLRLCLYTGQGRETAAWLESSAGIACEMADARNAVFLLSPLTTQKEMARLHSALAQITAACQPPPRIGKKAPPPLPGSAVPPRRALFGRQETLPWRECRGRIAARPVAIYPPGVPLAAGGEIIDNYVLETLEQEQFEGNIQVLA